MRRIHRSDENQEAIVKALRKAGVRVWHIGRPCDLLTRWAGLWLPLEVKASHKSKFSTKEQEEFVTQNDVPIVTTPEEALRAVGLL